MFLNNTNFIYLCALPVIYCNINISKYTNFINFIYLSNIIFNYKTFLLDTVDYYTRTKYYIEHFYKNSKDKLNNFLYKIGYYKSKYFEYELLNAYLYKDISNKVNIKLYFDNNYDIDKINKNTFMQIFDIYNIEINSDNVRINPDIRIRLDFKFYGKKYILYIPYSYNKNIYTNCTEKYIPYPPFTNDIMNKYKNNIVEPFNKKYISKYPLYSLMNINFKFIDECKINYNNNTSRNIKEYIEMINTPFYDMGILYNCSIPIAWICSDNYVKCNDFKSIYLKYSSYYFNEEKMEFKENIIEIDNLNDIFVSDILEEYICNKNLIEK